MCNIYSSRVGLECWQNNEIYMTFFGFALCCLKVLPFNNGEFYEVCIHSSGSLPTKLLTYVGVIEQWKRH